MPSIVNMSKTILRPLAAATAVALVAALVVPAAAVADDGEKKIKIKKVHRVCEGENCPEGEEHRVIFLGEDGELEELGEGKKLWVDAGDHGLHVLAGSGTYLGVQLTELTDELRAHFGAPEGVGVMVAKVMDGSPAAIAGVRVGDVITGVDSEAVTGGGALGRLIRQRDDGETVALEVYRDGRVETLSPTLAKGEGMAMAGMPGMKARVMRHGGDHLELMSKHGAHGMRKIMVRCEGEDGEEDCEVTMGDGESFDVGDFDCGGAEECNVQVECDGADCECTANGEAVDCDDLPGFSARHGG